MRFSTQGALTLAVLLGCAHSAPAYASDFTDLVDAADDFDDLDDSTYDGFDFNIEPSFRFDTTSAKIAREAACVPNEAALVGEAAKQYPRVVVDPGRCREAIPVTNKEMLYEGTTSTLNFELKAGLYKDLEFHLNVPFVIGHTNGLKYADEGSAGNVVDASNSSVDPDTSLIKQDAERDFDSQATAQVHADNLDAFGTYRYFALSDEFSEIQRSGLADPSLGLHWSPFNDARDDTKATLLIGLDWMLPIAPIRNVDNEAVGRGVHELQFKIASSKKFRWIEPYFGIQYFLPLPASDSLIRRRDTGNNGQVFKAPPQRGEVAVGTEFIPFEDPMKGARVGIDLRFTFGYTSEGRDYTVLSDHIGESECNGKTLEDVLPKFEGDQITNPDDVACGWIVRQPSNAHPNDNPTGTAIPVYDLARAYQNGDTSRYFTDPISTVDSYGTFSGRLGINYQASRYFQLKGSAALTHQLEHFITNARTGRDVSDDLEDTNDDTVDLEGFDQELERNPVYNAAFDSNGNRFRVQEHNTWTLMVEAALQF